MRNGAGGDVYLLTYVVLTYLYLNLYQVVTLLADAGADLRLSCKTFGKNNTALHQATICRDTYA